jgi:hypothetical protein
MSGNLGDLIIEMEREAAAAKVHASAGFET